MPVAGDTWSFSVRRESGIGGRGWLQITGCLLLAGRNASLDLFEKLPGILVGLDAPLHILQRGASVEDIVHIAAVGVTQAQARRARASMPPAAL